MANMSNYEVRKNTLNDYKYILFTAPWSGRYQYTPRTHKGLALYKAMVMSSDKVHLWVAPAYYRGSLETSQDWQLVKMITVEPQIEDNDFDALFAIVQRYL